MIKNAMSRKYKISTENVKITIIKMEQCISEKHVNMIGTNHKGEIFEVHIQQGKLK